MKKYTTSDENELNLLVTSNEVGLVFSIANLSQSWTLESQAHHKMLPRHVSTQERIPESEVLC